MQVQDFISDSSTQSKSSIVKAITLGTTPEELLMINKSFIKFNQSRKKMILAYHYYGVDGHDIRSKYYKMLGDL